MGKPNASHDTSSAIFLILQVAQSLLWKVLKVIKPNSIPQPKPWSSHKGQSILQMPHSN